MNKRIKRACNQLFQNENENENQSKWKKRYDNFVKLLTQYCNIENNLLEVYRLLLIIKLDIQSNMNKHSEVIFHYNYLCQIIDIEIEIILLKIKEPELRKKIPKLLKWTDCLTDLAEIIIGISKSINRGKVKQIDIQECFEFIFQVKIGNISEKKEKIFIRKHKPMYIDKIKEVILQELNR